MSSRTPLYPLRTVQDLATAGLVDFTRKAQNQVKSLGFSLAQAKDHIAWLDLSEFRKTKDWPPHGELDDYLPLLTCPQFGDRRKVYVKLKLYRKSDGTQAVFVVSFHTEKPLSDD